MQFSCNCTLGSMYVWRLSGLHRDKQFTMEGVCRFPWCSLASCRVCLVFTHLSAVSSLEKSGRNYFCPHYVSCFVVEADPLEGSVVILWDDTMYIPQPKRHCSSAKGANLLSLHVLLLPAYKSAAMSLNNCSRAKAGNIRQGYNCSLCRRFGQSNRGGPFFFYLSYRV